MAHVCLHACCWDGCVQKRFGTVPVSLTFGGFQRSPARWVLV